MPGSREHPPPTGSYYEATVASRPSFPPPVGAVRCDVAIVGGGYTGLSSALHLAQRGYDVTLLEARRLGWGASGRNGGQVGSGQRRDQRYLERHLGVEEAHRLWQLGEAAKALVKRLIAEHDIVCDFTPGIINMAHRPAAMRELDTWAAHLARDYGYPHLQRVAPAESREWVDSPAYCGGMLDRDAAHLHPLRYALGLARAAEHAGARLHENCAVTAIERSADGIVLHGAGGAEVRAGHAVLACNGYLDGLEPQLAGRILPLNNFIVATGPLPPAQARRLIRDRHAVADSKFVINYFRLSADDRLLFGGGETYSRRFPADIAGFVRRPLRRVFPQLADVPIEHAWGGTLAVTLRRLPGFGRLHGGRVLYAHGFSGHGVALATLAGQLIAEALAGAAERFDVMARLPQPAFPGGTLLRTPIQALAMLYFALRDRI